MKIAILSIGDELLQGNVLNSNATYFSKELHDYGYETAIHLTINDEGPNIIKAIHHLHNNYDLIIISGGLGPTSDDVTKESIAQALNLKLNVNEVELVKLKQWFSQHHIIYQDVNTKQALFSDIDNIIINYNGTANGYYFTKEQTSYWVLPGPPSENRIMFKEYLKTLISQTIYEKNIYLINIGESSAEAQMHYLYEKYPTLKIGTYMQDYGIIYRLISEDEQAINACHDELIKLFRANYVASSKNPIADLVDYLINNQLIISSAESCTAGLVASLIADIPHASKILKESIITYDNEAKQKYLLVSSNTLNKYSEISAQCAKEMAFGLQKLNHSDIALSITGLAGPTGGTPQKPIGLVYFGILINKQYYPYQLNLRGNRNEIRLRAAKFILMETYRLLTNK
ncbi:MAG: nicotinamide-nucleotide amidohydrolase family protein [Bacilli bacterium]|jgi:nicotinamide-nucleotide amidase|nr:nicotinamide-nucleotide amidohydrolase family protein [Bacilli bacterium]